MSVRALVLHSPDDLRWKVAGLGLVERWQRSLADHGVREPAAVTLGELRAALAGGPRVPVLLAWADSVAEHVALEHFIEHAGSTGPVELRVLSRVGERELFPVAVLGAELAERAAELTLVDFASAEALARAVGREELGPLERLERADGYHARVSDPASQRRASFGLLERQRWRPGGLVAKYLNRPISIRLSSWLVDTPVTPNQATWFAFALGAAGVTCVFAGGYANTVLGTFLLQLNSIVDGVDGELARVRHEASEYGAYLDSVCDEVLNAALLVAVGHELSARSGPGEPVYLVLGAFAAGVSFLYALVHWHCKVKHGLGFYWWFEAYKPRREVQRSTSPWSYLKKLTMKESFLLLFLIAAVAGFLHVLLWAFVLGSLAVVALFTIHIPIKRARW